MVGQGPITATSIIVLSLRSWLIRISLSRVSLFHNLVWRHLQVCSLVILFRYSPNVSFRHSPGMLTRICAVVTPLRSVLHNGRSREKLIWLSVVELEICCRATAGPRWTSEGYMRPPDLDPAGPRWISLEGLTTTPRNSRFRLAELHQWTQVGLLKLFWMD